MGIARDILWVIDRGYQPTSQVPGDPPRSVRTARARSFSVHGLPGSRVSALCLGSLVYTTA